jgi:23S rRNA pseudouridine2605 synthase
MGRLSRSQTIAAIRNGRVAVNGRIVHDPGRRVDLRRERIELDGARAHQASWRTLVFHKPRGVVTTRRDPAGRRTVFDVIGDSARGLVAVGRLDLATSGLLVLTNDTQLANRITDPAQRVRRLYLVTVRGEITASEAGELGQGLVIGRERLRASSVTIRKTSKRESHLTIELQEGRNREVRRLFQALGHEVTRLKRVRLGGLDLGELAPGEWRELSRGEANRAFPARSNACET